jgi:amino acid transporter
VSPLADVARASMGDWAGALLLGGASLSMFGYLGGMTLSMPRMLFALARDGFLPAGLAVVHPVSRSPQRAILVQSTLAVALALSGTFESLAILANVSVLALYLGCALAAWRLRARGIAEAGMQGGIRTPLAGLAPWLACAVIAWLLTGLTAREWLGFAVCVGVASLPYVLARRAA